MWVRVPDFITWHFYIIIFNVILAGIISFKLNPQNRRMWNENNKMTSQNIEKYCKDNEESFFEEGEEVISEEDAKNVKERLRKMGYYE